jgi:hypothetical protein
MVVHQVLVVMYVLLRFALVTLCYALVVDVDQIVAIVVEEVAFVLNHGVGDKLNNIVIIIQDLLRRDHPVVVDLGLVVQRQVVVQVVVQQIVKQEHVILVGVLLVVHGLVMDMVVMEQVAQEQLVDLVEHRGYG